MNCSDKTGLCPDCDRRLGLNTWGRMSVHGPQHRRCPGSGQPPITGSIKTRAADPALSTEPVTSPPPLGLSSTRWEQVTRSCRQMDERANRLLS